jgi:5-methylcytosine-specific restriction endonuclease McrA
MSRRFVHRVALPRSPGGLSRHVAPTTVRNLVSAKRSMKRAAMRDCSRRCVYCATCLDLDSATLDHVYPISKGGPHVLGNLVSACAPCNRMKGDMLPFEFFARYPQAGANFVRYARAVHRALKRGARRAVSLAYAA